MKDLVRWLIIAALAGVYLVTIFAVLHPRVSPAYAAFYIARTSSDWQPVHYAGTPQEGITFSRRGLPEWVESTRGLSVRDDWGRWTDEDLGDVAGLALTRPLSGDLCVDFTARAVPWIVGQTFVVQVGNEKQSLRIATPDLTEYRVQFTNLQAAGELDILTPPGLPRVRTQAPNNNDMRRLGLNLATLRIVPGSCGSGEMDAGTAR